MAKQIVLVVSETLICIYQNLQTWKNNETELWESILTEIITEKPN